MKTYLLYKSIQISHLIQKETISVNVVQECKFSQNGAMEFIILHVSSKNINVYQNFLPHCQWVERTVFQFNVGALVIAYRSRSIRIQSTRTVFSFPNLTKVQNLQDNWQYTFTVFCSTCFEY